MWGMNRVIPVPVRRYYSLGEDDCSSGCSDLKHSLMVRPREQHHSTGQVQSFFAETPGSSSRICWPCQAAVLLSRQYAAPVWDACSQHDTIAMERFQLSMARAILHVRRRQTHNVDVLATIGWPTLAWRRRRQKLFLLWDLLHGGGPPSLRSQVPSPVSSRCSYSFRNPWRYLFRRVVLPAVWSLFFLLLLLCLILCLSLFFAAPPTAHFCKLLISFFLLISFLTVCHRSRFFSYTFFP